MDVLRRPLSLFTFCSSKQPGFYRDPIRRSSYRSVTAEGWPFRERNPTLSRETKTQTWRKKCPERLPSEIFAVARDSDRIGVDSHCANCHDDTTRGSQSRGRIYSTVPPKHLERVSSPAKRESIAIEFNRVQNIYLWLYIYSCYVAKIIIGCLVIWRYMQCWKPIRWFLFKLHYTSCVIRIVSYALLYYI